MRRYRFWLTLATFLTFDLIMFGAFVRGVDAGLGCPDWPGCYGRATPLGALEAIRIEEALRPTGPVTVFKAWVEMLHRYVAAGLGLVVVGLAVAATRMVPRWRLAAPSDQGLPSVGLAWAIVVWIILQGAFGAFTVTLKLMPAVVTAHLLGGMVLLALLVVQRLRLVPPVPVAPAAARLRGPLRWLGVLLLGQMALGAWVSSNYATLACPDFPLCQGAWWPEMVWAEGFAPWRGLGETASGAALPFAALTAIHLAHRLGACVVLVVALVVIGRAWRLAGLAQPARVLGGLLLAQVVTGVTTVLMGWPLAIAVVHTGGAAAAWVTVLVLESRSRQAARLERVAGLSQPAPAGQGWPVPPTATQPMARGVAH